MKGIKGLIIIGFIWFSILPANANSHLNGVAAYQELGREVFLGALYSAAPASADTIASVDQALVMEVRALDRITKRRWVNMWMQGIAINNRQEIFEAEAGNLVSLFDAFKGGLKKGDIFTLNYSPESGTSVLLDEVELMAGQSQDFFQLFLQAWIGPVPPSSEFKSGILGQSSNVALAERLSSITPVVERVAEVAEWLVADETDEQQSEEAAEEQTAEANTEETSQEPEPEQPAAQLAAVEPESPPEPAEQPAPVEQPTLVEQPEVVELPEEEVIVSVESLIAQQEYTTGVIQKIYSSLKYPRSAVQRNMEGTVRVKLQIMRDGSIHETLLAEESRHKILNKAAIKAVTKAAPFAPIPNAVVDDQMEFSIPVVFRLTN